MRIKALKRLSEPLNQLKRGVYDPNVTRKAKKLAFGLKAMLFGLLVIFTGVESVHAITWGDFADNARGSVNAWGLLANAVAVVFGIFLVIKGWGIINSKNARERGEVAGGFIALIVGSGLIIWRVIVLTTVETGFGNEGVQEVEFEVQ